MPPALQNPITLWLLLTAALAGLVYAFLRPELRVKAIGYGAFLAGPPLLGALGDAVGTLDSLLAVAVLMGPATLAVFAARRPGERA